MPAINRPKNKILLKIHLVFMFEGVISNSIKDFYYEKDNWDSYTFFACLYYQQE